MVSFEIFVKAMPPSLSELKVLPSFCFAFKIPDNRAVTSKDVHIVVPFAYLSSSYSKFEWAENAAVLTRTKKLSSKQICCTTKWFL